MNEIEQAIFDTIMRHMRINGSEYCSTSEFESDVEDAAKEIAAQQRVQADECEACLDKSYITLGNGNVICWYCGRIRR